jgi:hypothetical protein
MFTPVEESIILSCVANGIPLCCSPPLAGRETERSRHERRVRGEQLVADIIPNSRALRELLMEYAYDGLGCAYDIKDRPDMWAMYFEKTVKWLSDLGR